MFRTLLKPFYKKMGERYDYNVDYMLDMDQASPGILAKLALISPLGSHNKIAGTDAYYLAKLAAISHLDCGPCLRLVSNMAKEAGVANETIVLALTDPEKLPDELTRVVHYATAVVSKDDATVLELAPLVLADWGEGGVAELSLAIAFGGFYPTLKRGLGKASACEPVIQELQNLQTQTEALA